MGGLLSDLTIGFLGKALDLLGLRQRVLAHNLANVETPGYRRMDVNFRAALLQAMDRKDLADWAGAGSISIGQARGPGSTGFSMGGVVVQANRVSRPDGNGVDVDQEMVELTENALLFQSVAAALRIKLAMLRSAISEGRR